MSSWFTLDSNKLKQIAASTLINAQKRIDQVLDIKDGAPNPGQISTASTIQTKDQSVVSDDFFSSFLGSQQSEPKTEVQEDETAVEQSTSFSNWNSWGDASKSSPATSSETPTRTDENSTLTTQSTDLSEPSDSSSIIDSVYSQQQGQSSASLAESSTITESSSSESANSVRPAFNIPSSESTITNANTESIADDNQNSNDEHIERQEDDAEHSSDIASLLPIEKRGVIDSWMNTGETTITEGQFDQSQEQLHDSTSSSSALYLSAYPPNEFSTSSMIDGELTPTAVDTFQSPIQNEQEPQIAAVSIDEDEDNAAIEQPSSPTHTTSSLNGNETNSKGSSDDGKQASCASSDIEVISSPSVTSGLALSTTDAYDKCRELRDARRPVVREVVGRFPTHSGNLQYHHHPLPIDNINKNTTSHFDAPSWSTLIDEAATEQVHYQNSNEENEDEQQKYSQSETAKEIGELKERLDLREAAFKKLTDESNELYQTNQSLKQTLAQLEQRTSRLTNEFQQTIENLSMKIEEQKPIIIERDHLKKQLGTLQKQLFESSTSSGNTMSVLRDKEEQIQQLLEEGEKLSKTQLQHTNIIKKLRTKEKETDAQLTSLNARIEKLNTELDEAKKTILEHEENEKQLKENVRKLEKSSSHYEKECLSLKSLYEDAEEQIRSTKVALENSVKEIAELNKTKAASESKVVEAALSAEILLREEIRLAVEKERVLSRQEQEKLQITIDELRLSIQRNDAQLNRKEQILRQENHDLRQRLQEAESRNEELTQNMSSATRPLLRQIETLQTTYLTQINSLEKTERQLTERLAEMQSQYALSVEHERVAQETLLETNAKWKLAEAQLSTFKQDKIRLTSELDVMKMKFSNLEETRFREKNQIDSMQEAFTQQINSLIQEKRQLELDSELEKSKYEGDLKRLQIVHDALKEKHDLFDTRSISRTDSNLESSLNQQRSRRSSGSHETPTTFAFDRSPFVPTPKPSVYEALRNTGAIAVLESLESQLKEKEGEITLLQSEIADLERTRESMARELVNLSTANEKLQQQTKDFPILQEKFKELEKRYDALLTMYGEKQEEADELRLDLADVKSMYRAQIDDLVKQVSHKR